MVATIVDITMEQGATFEMSFVWANDEAGTQPIDLTGAQMRMQVRRQQQSDVLIEAVSPTEIVLGGLSGTVAVTITDEVTSLLPLKKCRYDMEAEMPDGKVHRVIEGSVTVRPNITQEPGEPVLR